jgi:uncharacterized protein (DUF58 family)
VGMLLFTDKTEIYSPPRKGKKNALKIIRDILYFESKEKSTNLEDAIKHIWSIAKKKSIIFILSDFIAADYEHSLKILARKHDVIAFKINDPAEVELPAAGIIDFVDPETGELYTVNTLNPKLRRNYATEYLKKNKEISDMFKKNNIDLVNLSTDKSYIYDLMKFFKLRNQKRR